MEATEALIVAKVLTLGGRNEFQTQIRSGQGRLSQDDTMTGLSVVLHDKDDDDATRIGEDYPPTTVMREGGSAGKVRKRTASSGAVAVTLCAWVEAPKDEKRGGRGEIPLGQAFLQLWRV